MDRILRRATETCACPGRRGLAAGVLVLGLILAGCASSERASAPPPVAPPPVAAERDAPTAVPPPTEIRDRWTPERVFDGDAGSSVDSAEEAPAEARACSRGETRKLRTPRAAYAAKAKGDTVAYGRPGGKVLERFGPVNANDFPTVFGVLGAVLDEACEPAWYRVQLPVRPNGLVGYVRAEDVEVIRVTTRILVDLSERRLDFFENGERVLSVPAAIGAAITPTPVGEYYVNQRLTTTETWGPFGPAALGISAFSPVLQDWIQGGPIAIHGTNQPDLIGQEVSHGCIRVENDTLLWLFERTPAGTPVSIRV